jgi:hypothetical protein
MRPPLCLHRAAAAANSRWLYADCQRAKTPSRRNEAGHGWIVIQGCKSKESLSMAKKRRTAHSRGRAAGKSRGRWSARVTRESDALDLKKGVFSKTSPRAIALSLKRSAEHSHRRKSDPYRSAMSMLTFYINRGGKNLPAGRKKILQRAKDELRDAFGR